MLGRIVGPIVRKFSSNFMSTKLLLFKAFCTPIYGCSLWCCMFQYSLNKLECGPMPNLMAALPNTGGALCSTPQSLADAHY